MDTIENDKTLERLTKLEGDVHEILGNIDSAARFHCSALADYLDQLIDTPTATIYVGSFDKLAKSKGRLEALHAFAKEKGFEIKEIINPQQEDS